MNLALLDYGVNASLVTPQPLYLIGTLWFFLRLELVKNFFKLLSMHLKESLGLPRLILLLKLDQASYGCQLLFLRLR